MHSGNITSMAMVCEFAPSEANERAACHSLGKSREERKKNGRDGPQVTNGQSSALPRNLAGLVCAFLEYPAFQLRVNGKWESLDVRKLNMGVFYGTNHPSRASSRTSISTLKYYSKIQTSRKSRIWLVILFVKC